MEWLEITVPVSHEETDRLCARLEDLGIEGLVIDDGEDFKNFLENERKYWDYVDEKLLREKENAGSVKFYLENSAKGRETFCNIRKALGGREISTALVKDEDWENNWREFYKPVETGKKLLIVPEWEENGYNGDRIVLRLDPGLIFGTGAHATTQMCLCALERYISAGDRVLDLGCGSGILGIAAVLLGAESATGCDIDEKAPGIAEENAMLNGIDPEKFTVYCGDILSDQSLKKRLAGEYDLILANIVADVIISLAAYAKQLLKDDGVFICSGIIQGREEDVTSALRSAGFAIKEELMQDNWNCYVCGRDLFE